MCGLAVSEFPQTSVNVQVLVITAGQLPVGALSLPVTDPATSQLSVYASDVIAGTSPIHSTVTFASAHAYTAVCVSSMIIFFVSIAELPQTSVNVQVLVITAGQLPVGA